MHLNGAIAHGAFGPATAIDGRANRRTGGRHRETGRAAFQLLIAVILSAQATDKSVNLATRQLFADAPTPQAILALGESGLIPY
ncbi:MAG: hypothetical protein JNL00_07745, partial [Candidatus Accumulibacter sp.]|nr:hypothetical protein [Accumulibacter sp.]